MNVTLPVEAAQVVVPDMDTCALAVDHETEAARSARVRRP